MNNHHELNSTLENKETQKKEINAVGQMMLTIAKWEEK